ncbi:MAG TPA: hypothetical protein VNX21_09575 [Candidatus Thermoplasmatota archaeon]|nr:hypothetical protein [Candidatus Thermoplasmatota archaeon]
MRFSYFAPCGRNDLVDVADTDFFAVVPEFPQSSAAIVSRKERARACMELCMRSLLATTVEHANRSKVP